MKTFKLTVTEGELIALIHHHNLIMIRDIESDTYTHPSTESSERIHTLTKRLNKDTPEIEAVGSQTIGEFCGDPRPLTIHDEYGARAAAKAEPPQAEAAKTEQQSGW